jgi:hypothetical protein
MVRDVQNRESKPVQVGIAAQIAPVIRVRLAVDLDTKFGTRAEEIDDCSSDHFLATELEAFQLSVG